jgi:hypothetical protein
MRTFVIGALLGCLAYGQRPTDPVSTRVFSLTHLESPREIQEAVNVVRALLGVSQVSVNPAQRTLTVQAGSDQIGMGEWLLSELDQPPATGTPDSTLHEYRLPGTNEVARVFYLRAASPQIAQELINMIRSLGNLQRIMPDNARRAIVARGNTDQIGLAEWLVTNLDTLPAPQSRRATVEYRTTRAPAEVTRVYYMAAGTPEEVQQVINVVRRETHITRVMPFDPRLTLALRGTDSEVTGADQLIQQLDARSAEH